LEAINPSHHGPNSALLPILHRLAYEACTGPDLLDLARREVIRTINLYTALGRSRHCIAARVWNVIEESTRTPLDVDLHMMIVIGQTQRLIRTKTLVYAAGGTWELRLRDWASSAPEVVQGTYRRQGAQYTWQRRSPHWTPTPPRPYPLSWDEGATDVI